MTILKQIARGEGKTLEFKETLPASERLAKTLIAFANTGGGKILFAVSQRDKVRFKLGGRKIDALFQHTVEINAERILITGGCILIIFYFLIRKEDREHGTQMMDADRDTGLLSSLF